MRGWESEERDGGLRHGFHAVSWSLASTLLAASTPFESPIPVKLVDTCKPQTVYDNPLEMKSQKHRGFGGQLLGPGSPGLSAINVCLP